MRSAPSFSFKLPKNPDITSAERMAQQYGYICEVFEHYGETRVGFWEKALDEGPSYQAKAPQN